MVVYRLLQGICGAALVPLSQSVLLQINPPERHGQAMAVFGIGTIMGPIMGPALGGWLTQDYSWRWVFFINLPVGLLCTVGVLIFIRHTRNVHREPFDFGTLNRLADFRGSPEAEHQVKERPVVGHPQPGSRSDEALGHL
jgi:DHA2 family multidrug resistance protein